MEEEKLIPSMGMYVPTDIPRSNIYVSKNSNQEHKKQTKFASSVGNYHFHMILNVCGQFTSEIINACGGLWRCYNCNRNIMGQIYFYPTNQTLMGEYECSIIPHCRTGCVFRTLREIPNNANLLALFALMYGPDVICAPPRYMLYIPGGNTESEYHDFIDNQIVLVADSADIVCFQSPMRISGTMLNKTQMVEESVSYIDELHSENKKTIGPSMKRDNSTLNVIELEPNKLRKSALSKTFDFESTSFDRPAIRENPHMSDIT
jgi:hypothetical protein